MAYIKTNFTITQSKCLDLGNQFFYEISYVMILLYYVNDMGSEFQQHTLTIDKERKKASQTGL